MNKRQEAVDAIQSQFPRYPATVRKACLEGFDAFLNGDADAVKLAGKGIREVMNLLKPKDAGLVLMHLGTIEKEAGTSSKRPAPRRNTKKAAPATEK